MEPAISPSRSRLLFGTPRNHGNYPLKIPFNPTFQSKIDEIEENLIKQRV